MSAFVNFLFLIFVIIEKVQIKCNLDLMIGISSLFFYFHFINEILLLSWVMQNKDVWNDFSISITLMSNNTSIPSQWRNYYPYWIYNADYRT